MTPVRISPQALSRELDGETVLVHLDSGTYFGLDPVGTAIWQWLQQGTPVEEIPLRLTQAFDVDEDTARTDLEALLADLMKSGLLEKA